MKRRPFQTSDTQHSEVQAPRADLLWFTEVETQPVDWLWPQRLAAGSVSLLSGNPGSGKTWVALAIAAALSNGGNPDAPGTAARSLPVLYAATHHLGAEVIRPRFLSLGGDPAQLVLLRGAAHASAPLSLRDTPILEDALHRTGARLLILDPLHTYLAAGSRHRMHEAARLLDNLARLAEKHHCCILLVRHLRPRGRTAATVELSAAARTEFLVGSSPDAPALSALVQTKSSLGPLAPSLGYRLDPASVACPFHWTGPSRLTAEDLEAEKPIAAGLPRRKLAAAWLRRQLSNGPMAQQAIERAARQDGEALITLRRAKCDLGVLSTKNKFNGVWFWELPESAGGGNKTK